MHDYNIVITINDDLWESSVSVRRGEVLDNNNNSQSIEIERHVECFMFGEVFFTPWRSHKREYMLLFCEIKLFIGLGWEFIS
jgi:hypothetical protein